jgi:hypothetical protein
MSGTIYFIQGVNGGLIKIGYTTGDVDERRRVLQSGSPVELQIIATMAGSRYAEQRLHQRFRYLRRHNEWFIAETDLLHYIAEEAETWTKTPPVRLGWPWEPWKPLTAKGAEEMGPAWIKAIEERRLIELEKLQAKAAARESRKSRFA